MRSNNKHSSSGKDASLPGTTDVSFLFREVHERLTKISVCGPNAAGGRTGDRSKPRPGVLARKLLSDETIGDVQRKNELLHQDLAELLEDMTEARMQVVGSAPFSRHNSEQHRHGWIPFSSVYNSRQQEVQTTDHFLSDRLSSLQKVEPKSVVEQEPRREQENLPRNPSDSKRSVSSGNQATADQHVVPLTTPLFWQGHFPQAVVPAPATLTRPVVGCGQQVKDADNKEAHKQILAQERFFQKDLLRYYAQVMVRGTGKNVDHGDAVAGKVGSSSSVESRRVREAWGPSLSQPGVTEWAPGTRAIDLNGNEYERALGEDHSDSEHSEGEGGREQELSAKKKNGDERQASGVGPGVVALAVDAAPFAPSLSVEQGAQQPQRNSTRLFLSMGDNEGIEFVPKNSGAGGSAGPLNSGESAGPLNSGAGGSVPLNRSVGARTFSRQNSSASMVSSGGQSAVSSELSSSSSANGRSASFRGFPTKAKAKPPPR